MAVRNIETWSQHIPTDNGAFRSGNTAEGSPPPIQAIRSLNRETSPSTARPSVRSINTPTHTEQPARRVLSLNVSEDDRAAVAVFSRDTVTEDMYVAVKLPEPEVSYGNTTVDDEVSPDDGNDSDDKVVRFPRTKRIATHVATAAALFAPAACGTDDASRPVAVLAGLPGQGDNYLEPIEGGWVENEENGVTTTYVVGNIDVIDGNLDMSAFEDELMPEEYQQAVREMLAEPIVQLVVSEGKTSGVTIIQAEKDNGFFDSQSAYGENRIILEISNGQGDPEERIYFDRRVVRALGIHEATHAVSAEWAQYLNSGTEPEDPALAAKITEATAACNVIRDADYREFVEDNRESIAIAFVEVGKNIRRLALSKEGAQYDPTRLEEMADAMHTTATAFRKDAPSIYAPLEDPGCRSQPLYNVPFYVEGVNPEKIRSLDEYGDDLLTPVYNLTGEQVQKNDAAYSCVNDGAAIQEWLQTPHKIRAVHAFDNPGEATSAVVTVLAVQPDFLPVCLAAVSEQRRGELERVIGASLALTEHVSPQLIEILRRDPIAADIIKSYLN